MMIKDDTGKVSTMRVMCLFSLAAAIGYGYMILADGIPNTTTDTMFIGTYLAAAFGGKVGQALGGK